MSKEESIQPQPDHSPPDKTVFITERLPQDETVSIVLEMRDWLYSDPEQASERMAVFGELLYGLSLNEQERIANSYPERKKTREKREDWQDHISQQSMRDPLYGKINSLLTSKYDNLVSACEREEKLTKKEASTLAYSYLTTMHGALIDFSTRGIVD